MSTTNDGSHFENYRKQTEIKHEILAAYLPAYYNIIKKWERNLIYIDGFAGRGTYTKASTKEVVDGSPLRALKLIAESGDFSKQVSTFFIEADSALFPQLEGTVDTFYSAHPNIRKPVCLEGTFANQTSEIIKAVKSNLAPTFLFVDPCGVGGTDFNTIREVMAFDKCESFTFFNIDGVRRIAGLKKVGDTLVELMGSEARASALLDGVNRASTPLEREQVILTHYRQAIAEEMGAKYTTAFRIEHEDTRKTSHYLVHSSKHHLGFRIMKSVMWKRGHTENQGGGLGFDQASRSSFVPLFDLRGDAIKSDILKGLVAGPLRVSTFYEDWSERPNDVYCEPAYRQALLELESDAELEVLSKDGKSVVPVTSRRPYKGQPTLAKDYYVRAKRK